MDVEGVRQHWAGAAALGAVSVALVALLWKAVRLLQPEFDEYKARLSEEIRELKAENQQFKTDAIAESRALKIENVKLRKDLEQARQTITDLQVRLARLESRETGQEQAESGEPQ